MDRRLLLKSGAALGAVAWIRSTFSDAKAAVVNAIRPTPAKVRHMIVVDAVRHPVTDKFHREVLGPYPDLVNMEYVELEQKRDAILHLSTLRNNYQVQKPRGVPMAPGGTVTVAEAARLTAVTHVINVHRAVRWLEGRQIADFGFDGVDQVHGNNCRHACGCITQHTFDHHKAVAGEPHELHAHYSRYTCEQHRHLFADFKAHRAAVIADSA